MLQKILKALIRKHCKPEKTRYVEDILYPTTTYPLYICVQQTFNYCIKNRLMKRDDILTFKYMIDRCIKDQSVYQNMKWQNDIHFCYKKLKSHDISKKQMQKLLDFVNQFVIAIPEPITTVKHLRVIK